MRIGIGHADVVRVGIVRTAAVRASVARATVVCVCVERLLARVQLGEPRLGGLCLGRRAPASGHRPVRSPRAWRRQAGAARAGGVVVSIRGGCGGARAVLTQRPCAAACARAPTPELGVQQILPRPRPLGPARGLGLVARAGIVGARAERQRRACTPPPRAPSPCRASVRRDGAPQVSKGGSRETMLHRRRVYRAFGNSNRR